MMKIKSGLKGSLLSVLILLSGFLVTTGPWGSPAPARAATTNYAEVVTGVQVVPFHISGQYTATAADVIQFQIPFKAKVLGVSATARASGGTSPTLTVDVQEDGTSILGSAISITAGTVSEGTVSDSTLADESSITVDLAIGGTSPTWDDITVLLTLRRTN